MLDALSLERLGEDTRTARVSARGTRIAALEARHLDAALELVCDGFVEGSAIHRALELTREEYRDYLRAPFEEEVAQGLSLVAIDERSGAVVGCLVACDYARQVPGDPRRLDKLAPLCALLGRLQETYEADAPIAPGHVLFVDMAAVSPAAGGRGVYRALREAAHRVGREHGFERIVGELSSSATQHVCVDALGHTVRAECEIATFEHAGVTPFATVREPRCVQLVEGRL